MVSDFKDVTKSLMDEYLSWNPSFATQVGWHKYDHVLRDPRPSAVVHQGERCQEILRHLSKIRPESLAGEDQLDRDLAIYLFELHKFEIQDLRLFERHSTACEEIGYSLFFLSMRSVPSLHDRLESMTNRIEKIPEFLAASRKAVSKPYRIWNELALDVGRQIPGLIRSIEKLGNREDPSLSRKLKNASDAAIGAVLDHNRWIEEVLIPSSSEEYAVSSEEYGKYLDKKCYGVTMDEALEIGEIYLAKSRSEMAAIARSLVPSGSAAEALETMKADHPPTFTAALEEYRASSQRARDFVLKHDLVTIPDNEELIVAETPEFMRPVFPSAGQFEPGKFDGNRTGFFLVTPDEENPSLLREHSHVGIVNTTVHEGYPGHHVQGICANTHPSYIRILVQSADFGEGWGLYSEEMMNRQGYANNDLEKLTIMNDLLFRLWRLVIEIRLAKGETTIEDAAATLSKECSMDPQASTIEATNCAVLPTYYMSYFIGKLAIQQLREEVEAVLGDKFTLRFFHDSLLYNGCLPLPFMRRGIAMRLKEQYAKELPPQNETLYEYAMRNASKRPA